MQLFCNVAIVDTRIAQSNQKQTRRRPEI